MASGDLLSSSMLTTGGAGDCESSGVFSVTAFELSRGRDLGMAGIIGTAGIVDLCVVFGATGVVSPFAGIDWFCTDEGVVGCVESVSSDVGRFVEGVSGRGILASVVLGSSGSGLAPCWIIGSSTDSEDSCGVCFLFLRARLVGQGRSGRENQGN